MTVRVYEPAISVILKKNIGRTQVAGGIPTSQRFQGTQRTIDLTPFIGESGVVQTMKSIREPAGMFSITLADKMPSFEMETLYALIEPMDVIEIRMARDISIYNGNGLAQSMPIMMRGFVTEVSREEVMSGGRPARAIVVSGQDYGKILAMYRVVYLPNGVTGQLLTTQFKFFANYGVNSQVIQEANDFVSGVVQGVINPFLTTMQTSAKGAIGAAGGSPVLLLGVDTSVQDGVVSAFGTNEWPGGTVWSLLTYYGDVGPWNEMFVEDREVGPVLVYRPTPFKNAGGQFIQEPYASDARYRPTVNHVTDDDLISIRVARSDSDVANYFWVDAPRFQLNDGRLLQTALANQGSLDLFYLKDYPNASPDFYGFRSMEVQTQQGPRADSQKEAEYEQINDTLYNFVGRRRSILIENNKDNIVFENGRMKLKGNEAIKAGSILSLRRGGNLQSNAQNPGGLVSEQYVVGASHEYRPYQSYTTSVIFERGTSFINRSQIGSNATSPYLAEMNVGGLYQ